MAPHINKKILDIVEANFVERNSRWLSPNQWVEKYDGDGNEIIKRNKPQPSGVTAEYINSTWYLVTTKEADGNGGPSIDLKPILTNKTMVKTIYKEYITAIHKNVTLFCSEMVKAYEGTTKWIVKQIVGWIKDAEEQIAGGHEAVKAKREKQKRARMNDPNEDYGEGKRIRY